MYPPHHRVAQNRAMPVHYSRKLFHATGVLVVLVYRLAPLPRAWAAGLLFAIVALLGVLDLLRSRSPAVQAWFRRRFRAILDEKDLRGWNGSTLYFAGCAAAVALFPPDPACGGILALALGDASAAIAGGTVRSPRRGRVSLAGTLACLLAATAGGLFFFSWPVALAGGAAAALLEAFSGSKLDNLAIPVGTALVLFLLG